MKRFAFIILFILPVILLPAKGEDLDSALKRLDKVVEDRAGYAAMKEAEINGLKEQLKKTAAPGERYNLLDRIEEEYRYFSIDSSFAYINRKKELANSMQDEFLICAYNLNYAEIYTKSGYFREAQEILDKFENKIPENLYGYYLGILKNFYEIQMEATIRPSDKDYYSEKLDDCLLKRVDYFKNSEHQTPYIEQLVVSGRYDEAEALIHKEIANMGETHSKAILHYLLSKINESRGEVKERAYNLALTAILDISLGVREHKALAELAILLYSAGDIERADKYMKAAMDDAASCNARPRYLESVDFFTLIDNAFQKKLHKQNTYIIITLVIISIFALSLAILLRMFYRKNTKLRIARQNLHDANKSLSKVNKKLKESYSALEDATSIKEEYIGMYMDQCSSYLSKLDSYRKSLRKLLNVGNMDELAKAIKSGEFVDQEVKEFYSNFDVAFLHLYPTFVEDFNNLLKEDERLEIESPEKLTPELRIHALIRLGIDDSAKIAMFLRYSVSTIYNYRTKMRNKAKGDRNSFDEQVKKIGISQ